MSATIETLVKARDGHRYATITSYEVEYRVKVITTVGGKYTHVYIAGGDYPVYREVGTLVKEAIGSYRLKFRNQDGTMGGDYRDNGKLLHFIATLVHTYVGNAEHAKSEAAKSPEQVAEEQAAHEAAHNARRNARIAKEAESLLATLEALVPDTTVHYAVEQARSALTTLAAHAERNSIKTADPA